MTNKKAKKSSVESKKKPHKLREMTEKLFSDLENLSAQEPADQAKNVQKQIAVTPDHLTPRSPTDAQEVARMQVRIRQLERQLREKQNPTTDLYEKEKLAFAYENNSLESLQQKDLAKKSTGENNIQSPLSITGQEIGSMQIQDSPERIWDPEDENLVNTVAQQVSLQIQSLRLLADAERARTEAESATRQFMHENWESYLDAIHQNKKIGYAYDQASVHPYLDKPTSENDLSEKIKIMDEEVGTLTLKQDPVQPFTEDDKTLITSVADQIAQQVENIRLLADASRARAEAEEATRRLTLDSWQEFVDKYEDGILGFSYDTVQVSPLEDDNLLENISLSVPLEVRGEAIGQLAVKSEDTLSEDAIELASAIAAQANIHIENIRLLEETEHGRQQLDKRAAELETVAKVSTAAAAIREPGSLLRSVVDLTNYSFKLYHTSIYLLIETEDLEKNLKLYAASGKTGHKMLQDGYAINIDEEKSIIAHAAKKNSIVIVKNARHDALFSAHPSLPDTQSAMAIPMIVADKLIGIFNVEADNLNRFSEEDKQTYNTLASQTAVALQNAQLYEEQIETVERLRELDQLKSSFLANMSHELRTPLNSISGFTQVMLEGLDGPLTDEMQEDLGLIDKNAEHLLTLINEVLDMAKIEAGQLSVTMGPANIYQVLENVIKITRPLARENDLTISLKNNIPKDLIIMADDMRIQQVMINLIGNAMKFTHEGSVFVSSEVDKDLIRIKVADTGIGIPPDLLESIFEAFNQVDTSTTRKAGGTGLGLPISKRFIEMHNGLLWAESSGRAGEGTTLVLELPLILPEDKQQ
ncbi:MAG: GAF domain-containing protein [Anaerolineae bacterium]|jgi:signal transduction histidine kinase|nr:GAF domain-containing protein [Anaerolineae bacterium]MBT7074004.1 GAF domain-containing protein [Anaerolineae bacterium]MBT7781364.1 GAF domain-containing protein [Anaerolineae bacterium]